MNQHAHLPKAGIITSHYYFIKTNYGSLLQNFALQRYLEKMGLFPFLIRQEEISQPIYFREKIKFYLPLTKLFLEFYMENM